MATLSPNVTAALATLEGRWGAAAPRVVGSLATVPLPDAPDDRPTPAVSPGGGVIPTGFAALDAILGTGGVPRTAGLALRGEGSSGKTTLALRLAAEAQAQGSIVAWLDVARAFDPVEAVARGVRLRWLVVVTPGDLDEAFSIGGALVGGRSVDVLVVDLPPRLAPGVRPGAVADRLHRLAALARRAGTLLVLLESPGGPAALGTAITESAGLRLELARRAWVRLGRDVVGQRTDVVVARNRFGPPGRRAGLRILYADGDERDACLAIDELLTETPVDDAHIPVPGKVRDATAPPAMASSPPRPRRGPLRLVAGGPGGSRAPDRPGWPAVDGRARARRERGGTGSRGATRDPARERPPARA